MFAKDKDGRIMNSSQRTKFAAMDLNGFISILSRLIPSGMHAKCQELELRHAELGLKEWCREFMDKLPKGATNWEWD